MAARAGITKKVSLSVHRDDLAMLKERARRLYGGNVSAVFAELIAAIKRREAWVKALAWYGRPIEIGEEERLQLDNELLGGRTRRLRSKRPRRKQVA
jgi:hypothetical protein